MWRSWKLGRAFGIDVFVHWSFLLLPLYVFFNGLFDGGLTLALFLVCMALAVFGCVVLHELGHALMARYFGIGTRDITLYPIGGVARLERMSESPAEEIFIALAGPAVNVVIAAVLLPLLWLLSGLNALGHFGLLLPGPGESFGPHLVGPLLCWLLASNILLAGFNMIPAFPMDGGRVLRALLAFGMDRLQATEIAVGVSSVLALGLAVLPFLPLLLGLGMGSPMLVLLAGFVFIMGRMELAALRHREAQRRAEAAWAEQGEVLDVLPADPEPGFTGFAWDNRARVWVVWRDGRPVTTFGAGPE
ncbi:MAG TPA: site-2 protease family protein [Gemmataceae bacterium]|nr:site-2 protease family protein [Gemmataceae bacterium]